MDPHGEDSWLNVGIRVTGVASSWGVVLEKYDDTVVPFTLQLGPDPTVHDHEQGKLSDGAGWPAASTDRVLDTRCQSSFAYLFR